MCAPVSFGVVSVVAARSAGPRKAAARLRPAPGHVIMTNPSGDDGHRARRAGRCGPARRGRSARPRCRTARTAAGRRHHNSYGRPGHGPGQDRLSGPSRALRPPAPAWPARSAPRRTPRTSRSAPPAASLLPGRVRDPIRRDQRPVRSGTRGWWPGMSAGNWFTKSDANQCHRCGGFGDTAAVATRECATMGVRAGTEHGAGVAGTDRVYRAAAVVALGSAVAALVVMCAAVRVHPWSMLGILVALPAAVIAGWHVVTRRGLARVLAGLIVLVAVVVPVLHVLAHRPAALLAAMVLFGFSMASARFALRPAGRRPRRGGRRRGARVTGAGRAVLLLNPRSGSGKAARLGLAALARQSGADVVPMRPGDDLGELAEDLVAGGAGVLGVAGGDGSMATVAAVAARHGLPFVCVPGRHPQPLRSRPRPGPQRPGTRDDGLPARGGGPGRPGRGQRPGVREQRLARHLRGDGQVTGITGAPRCGQPWTNCPT